MFRLIIFSCLFLAIFADSFNKTKPTEQRIIGGRDTEIIDVPYLVSVQYLDEHVCGGTIIGTKHILTAAHCVEDSDHARFSIRAGSKYTFKGGQDVDVIRVTSHPKFNKITGDYDAAVLLLRKPLTLGEEVRIAPLANVAPQDNEMILISGWGAVEEGRGQSILLQSVSLPVISKRFCEKRYKWRHEITDQMFCAGFPFGGKDSCHGDSGGPGMVNGKLAGIVSWGDGCAKKVTPGVYTNVPSISSWIRAEMLK